MNYSKWVYQVSLIVATNALLLACILDQFWPGAVIALGLGLFGWLGFRYRPWAWSNNLFFGGAVALVIAGGLLGFRTDLLLVALLGALAAWDSARFRQRIDRKPLPETIQKIEKRHLSLLFVALIVGGGVSLLALNLQTQLSFGVALALSVILTISLGLLYRLLRN